MGFDVTKHSNVILYSFYLVLAFVIASLLYLMLALAWSSFAWYVTWMLLGNDVWVKELEEGSQWTLSLGIEQSTLAILKTLILKASYLARLCKELVV